MVIGRRKSLRSRAVEEVKLPHGGKHVAAVVDG
jgi:hypothetical protein